MSHFACRNDECPPLLPPFIAPSLGGSPASQAIPGDQALTIAQADALEAYGDLAPYRIHLLLEEDGWHVDYELKDPRLKGGGPHYLIDPYTGAIRSKKYHQ
jgi:hypothetical protein